MLPSDACDSENWQLECIRQYVESALSNPITDDVNLTIAKIEIIDCKYVLVRQGHLSAEIAPSYPGSILHNDVNVVLKTDGKVSKKTHQCQSHPTQSVAYISADTHYARFHPILKPVAKEFYKQKRPRITFFTKNAPVLNKTLKAAIEKFSLTHHPAGSFVDLQVYWCHIVTTTVEPVPTLLACKRTRNARSNWIAEQAVAHEAITADAILDRAALIVKSDIIITDDTGIAMDAITSSVPVGFSSVPKNFADIQSSFDRYLLHKDRKVVTAEQKVAITDVIGNLKNQAYITGSEQELHALLVDHLQLPGSLKLTDVMSHEYSPIVKPYTSALVEPVRNDTLDLHLTNGRRKWRKFRESPKRFLHDSQHWALKPVKGFAR